jgi:hypothetical protein
MANRNEYRDALHNREIRRWKIAACVLGLLALYGLMGRMDKAAQVEQMAEQQPHQGFAQRMVGKVPTVNRVWI